MRKYKIFLASGFIEIVEGDDIQIMETSAQVLIYKDKKIIAIVQNDATVIVEPK